MVPFIGAVRPASSPAASASPVSGRHFMEVAGALLQVQREPVIGASQYCRAGDGLARQGAGIVPIEQSLLTVVFAVPASNKVCVTRCSSIVTG